MDAIKKGGINSLCCEICQYNTARTDLLQKHFLTRKHYRNDLATKKVENVVEKVEKVVDNIKKYECNKCCKQYVSTSGLWRHKKKCNFHELVITDNSNNQLQLKDLILEVVKKQQDVFKQQQEVVKQQQEQIKELTNTIKELIPKVGNNNTINQKFNIQVFLNEKCKDAINMSDFIKSIEVSFQQLDYTKQNGLVNGLSNVIIEHMNKLGLHQRPIHCTDLKRESLYIKDDDIWIKDITKENIKKAIKGASTKQFCALSKWTKENPDFIKNDSKQDYYTHTLVAIANNKENNEDKIIKKLCLSSFVKE